MSILVQIGDRKWAKTPQSDFATEAELQDLLYASPDLIERPDSGSLVFTKEAPLRGSGYVDLLGVASNGDILLVETKLARNPDIRRKIIGQILEYAAFLWNMSYLDVDTIFQKSHGKPLVELLSDRTEAFEGSEFQQKLQQNLAAGRFHLLIAVDEMTPDLEKIIAYVSSRGNGLKLEALAVRIYKQDDVSVLVPQRYGQLSQPSIPALSQPSEPSVSDIIARSATDHIRAMIELAVQLWREQGNFVDPGTGALSCKADINGVRVSFFWLSTSESYALQTNFGDLEKKGAPPLTLQALRARLASIKGFPESKCLTAKMPVIHYAGIDETGVRAFVAGMQAAIDVWRASVLEEGHMGSNVVSSPALSGTGSH